LKISDTFASTRSTVSICADLEHLERQLDCIQNLEGGGREGDGRREGYGEGERGRGRERAQLVIYHT
jgi:hypothetical protein